MENYPFNKHQIVSVNEPKYLDRQVLANSEDSVDTLFAIPSASCMVKPHCSNIRIIKTIFRASKLKIFTVL